MTNWTRPEDIRHLLARRWQDGSLLAARLTGERPYPIELRLKHPGPRDIALRFGAVQDWIRALEHAAKPRQRYGYELRYTRTRNRVQGSNALPVSCLIASEDDALRLLGASAATKRFDAVSGRILERFPALRGWLAAHPHAALEHAEEWERILAVLEWFAAHPRSGRYLRELDIPGVDSKLIEGRLTLFRALLDEVLPEHTIDRSATGKRGFLQRYGLRGASPLVRFRILDPELYVSGLDDLTLPAERFRALPIRPRRVFITENRINGLVFPDCTGAIVVFGLGYGLEPLARTPWLSETAIHYWGDLDTHGFGILERLRAHLPRARSLLMDRATLEAHRRLWGQEPAAKRYRGEPHRLDENEWALFDDLRHDRLGERVRLEQERIGFGWLERALVPYR